MSTWQSILALLIILTCLFLMLVVLIQRGRGAGLTGAFGGAGGSSAFGAKTGDVLTWATVVIALLFLTLTVVANFGFDESPKKEVAAEVVDLPEPPPLEDEPSTTTIPITIPPADQPADGPAAAPDSDENQSPPPSTSPPAGEPPVEPDPATPEDGPGAGDEDNGG